MISAKELLDTLRLWTLYENYNKLVFPKMLGVVDGVDNFFLTVNYETGVSSKMSFTPSDTQTLLEKQIDFLELNIKFALNPAFSLKEKFLFNIFRLDKILASLYPQQNIDHLVEDYLPFVIFTYKSFCNNSNLVISNSYTEEARLNDVKKTTINYIDFDKKSKIAIATFLSNRSHPLENPHHYLVDTFLEYVLLDGKGYKENLLQHIEKFNIWFYKELLLTGVNKDEIEKSLFDFWQSKNTQEIDKLILVLDLSKVVGVSSSIHSGFNMPGGVNHFISEYKWMWLHEEVIRFIYAPLRFLLKQDEFVQSLSPTCHSRLCTLLVKFNLVQDFSCYIEIKEKLGLPNIITHEDLHIFLSNDKLNGFLTGSENLKLLREAIQRENLRFVIGYIQKNKWLKNELFQTYLNLKDDESVDFEQLTRIEDYCRWVIKEEIKSLTLIDPVLNEKALQSKEDEIVASFKYYQKIMDLKEFGLFRMMCFAFNKYKGPSPNNIIEPFVERHYNDFYWEFLKQYVQAKCTFVQNKSAKDFVFTIGSKEYVFENVLHANSRLIEHVNYLLINKNLEQQISHFTEQSQDDEEFKL